MTLKLPTQQKTTFSEKVTKIDPKSTTVKWRRRKWKKEKKGKKEGKKGFKEV